jgi:hypothetical protein
MEERLRELEGRLAAAEQAIAHLNQKGGDDETVLTAPVRVVNERGETVLLLGADSDGGYVHLNNASGSLRVSIGCDAHGGFLDIIHAGSGRLAVTLTATLEGGSIEVTDKDGECLFDAGNRDGGTAQ